MAAPMVNARVYSAKAAGRDLASKLSMDGSWPFLDGRFVRPDAVVSIDLD